MNNRPSYRIMDNEEREAQIGSRNNIISKSFVTELWMKVITRAIDDIALYHVMKKKGKTLTEEDLANEESAFGFLFDDDYFIPMDDYLVDLICPKCKTLWTDYLSTIIGQNYKCDSCQTIINKKYIQYTITDKQKIKDITLTELISIWGVEDIKGFRLGVKRRIDEIVKNKLKN